MKNKLLNNIDNSIDILKNISINVEKNTYWDLNTLLDKHYAMKNILLEHEDIDFTEVDSLFVSLKNEVTNFLDKQS